MDLKRIKVEDKKKLWEVKIVRRNLKDFKNIPCRLKQGKNLGH